VKSLAECQLYTFVDTSYLAGRSPEAIAQQLCDGGSDLIQLRAKESTALEVHKMAEKLVRITDQAGVRLVINDYPAVAAAVGAPACHLGQEDFFDAGYTQISQLFDHEVPLEIGLSSHAPSQANRVVAAGADYVAIGPVYATGTKPSAKPVTLDYVRWAAANLSLPWFAIGGINLHNVEEIMEAGARRICVVSAILNAPDIVLACQKFKSLLSSHPVT
jgi:thiamine-phosphate pyrophosphorylase